jgi:mannose-1-phosphate guanylyltransferase
LEKMKAVLLVGGKSTRLRPLTEERPQSTLPLLNRPALEHNIAYLKKYGIRDIIITLNYLPEVIEDYFGDGENYGVKLTYFMEEEPRGTAGAVKNAESYLDSSFLVLSGNVFTNINLSDMLTFHRRKKGQATIALTSVTNPTSFGRVETSENGKVQKFIEKPESRTESMNWINAGIYILEQKILDIIPPGCNYTFERGLFPQLLQTGRPVYGYYYKGYWNDMVTPSHYHAINRDLLNSTLPNFLFKNIHNKPVFDKKKTNIHKTAKIKAPAIIGEGFKAGAGVQIIGPVSIGKDCRVDDNSVIEDTIIWDGVTIGGNTRLKRCIISNGAMIPDNQIIENSIVTHGQTIPLQETENTGKFTDI